MAYCPERVLPGRILKELVSNTRDRWLTPLAAEEPSPFMPHFRRIAYHYRPYRRAGELTENSFRDKHRLRQ